jgi:uncharacterized membrane protein YfcA
MNLKAMFWWIIAFAVAGFIGGFLAPYIPNTGNTTVNYVLGFTVPAIVMYLLWQQFFRKQAGGGS